MRRFAWLLALLGACVPGSGSSPVTTTEEEKAVKRAFEAWRAAIVAGNADEVLRGMSSTMISDWLYVRLGDANDPVLAKQRRRLTGAPSDDLDLWYVDNKSRNPERPSRLPISVLNSPWLPQTFKEYFEPEKAGAKRQYESIEVSSVYVDSLGATVVVRNKISQASDRYVMVYEGGWRVDGHIEARGVLPK
ncbi:MAG: hypothetical protein HYY17_15840 [Planctomycetes bacterium]|nr:hypothetical protein [Planctomycetota bacterium]